MSEPFTSGGMANATKRPGKKLAAHRPVESLIHVIRGQKVMLDADLQSYMKCRPNVLFKRVEKEYDDACAWAHQVSERVKAIDRWEMVDTSSLPKPPETTEGSTSLYDREMRDGFVAHNVIVHKRQMLQQALNRSALEEFLVIIAPLLAVIALALRITKVTGEIRLG